jgi:hypothetical protein
LGKTNGNNGAIHSRGYARYDVLLGVYLRDSRRGKRMKKLWETGLLSLFFFLSIIGVAIVVPSQEVRAGKFDNAVDFYNSFGSDIVFKDGCYYYATRGKAATVDVNTTHWSAIGYRMRVNTSSQSSYIYFDLSGNMVETVNEVYSDGYIYNLCRINLSFVKSKLAQKNRTVYNEFIIGGGYLAVDSCMITVKIDRYGNRKNSGSMDEYGNFRGSVYTDYNGIAKAAPWSNPSSLHSYFSKKINYVTELMSRQVVYVRYQNANGDYGGYSVVINKDYVYGENISWSRGANTCYNAASISYKAKKDKTSYISVTRKKYTVSVNAGTGIESVDGGGSYYYGASCIVDAYMKTGYTWRNWSGTYNSVDKGYSFKVIRNVDLSANAEANTYYIVFHPNGGSGTMVTLTCKYDQTYRLQTMSFTPPTHPCNYIGWDTDAKSHSASYSEKQQVRNMTSVNGDTFHLYGIWDYLPDLTCSDRYFTLYEAKAGIITEAELLRTVESTDREDGIRQISVKDYSPAMFTSFTGSGELEITYTTTDTRNNKIKKQVKVTIVDTNATNEEQMDSDGMKRYARFIDNSYYLKLCENGGLEWTSKWKNDVTYKDILAIAMNNVKGENESWSHEVQCWEFTKEDINQVRQYVKDKGIGNSKHENALEEFSTFFVNVKNKKLP